MARLERHTGNGIAKYAVVKLRPLKHRLLDDDTEIYKALQTLENAGLLVYGEPWSKDEFFVLMLKDEYAQDALAAYADAAVADDPEYAADVAKLADRAGPASPWRKKPD